MLLLWDAAQQRWRAFVVDYDLFTQARAMQKTLDAIGSAGQRLAGKAGPARTLRGVLLALGAALLAFALVVRSRRRRFGSSRGAGARPPALTLRATAGTARLAARACGAAARGSRGRPGDHAPGSGA